jgi:cleavage stimulation factor subunit 3
MYTLSDARALFEGVINTFPADRARPLWEQWARYIYQYSDLTAALEMERRIAEIYPTGIFKLHLFLNVSLILHLRATN